MKVKVNNNIFKVKTLTDKFSQAKGMMKKSKFDDGYNGLLFLMGGDSQSFWMKDCLINLDIIMIKNNKITKIHHNCPPCKTEDCVHYSGKGNIVLELDGGTCNRLGIKSGDFVEYVF
jgi:uncharacterized membrane protein (UPF0127 family)